MQASAPAQRVEQHVFDASTASIRAARRWVRGVAEQAGASGQIIGDIELVASEIVSNSVVHGSGGEFTVSTSVVDGDLVLEVTSHHAGHEIQEPRHWEVAPVESFGGRGLSLVRALSAEAWVDDGDDGTVTIGCRFELS